MQRPTHHPNAIIPPQRADLFANGAREERGRESVGGGAVEGDERVGGRGSEGGGSRRSGGGGRRGKMSGGGRRGGERRSVRVQDVHEEVAVFEADHGVVWLIDCVGG